MFGIDYERIHEKLLIGDKVLVDYGGVVLTVKGFEYEKTYLQSLIQRRKKTAELKQVLEQSHESQHDFQSNNAEGGFSDALPTPSDLAQMISIK